MKYGLTEAQWQIILAILANHDDIEEAVLFGSRAMNTYKEASDIDIAIKGEKLTPQTAGTVKLQMEDTYLPFFVDVVDYIRIDNPAFIEHIDTKGISIYKKGWREYKLDDIADVQTGPFGSQLHASDYVDFGVPSIMPKDIGQRLDINLDSIAYITEEDAQRLERYRVKQNDLVFSRRGDVEKCAFITTEMNGWLCGTGCLRVSFSPGAEVVPLFMAYYFSTRESKHWLTSHAVGTTMPNLNSTILGKFPLELPPLVEQEKITAVLASLDDKIDLLHRQNKTLENLAQTLFRHWFIDGADEDWEDGCLGDISENVRDSIGHEKIPSGTIYIGLEHIDKKSIALNRYGLSDDVQSNKYQFMEDDILFGKLRPYFHKVCFSPFSGVCSTDILVLRPKQPHYFCFSLFAFFQEDVVEYANLGSGGTRMPRTNWETLKQYPLQIPSEGKIEQFNGLVYPSIEKIKHNLVQIRTLEKLRDTLLPKLMSGEVRVRL